MYICVSGGSSDLTQESLHKSSGKRRRRMSYHEHTQVATHPTREVHMLLWTLYLSDIGKMAFILAVLSGSVVFQDANN